MIHLKNKVAVVTGGAKGIGEAISRKFHELGAVVHMIDVDETPGRQVVEDLHEKSGRSFFYECDVSDHQAVNKAIDNVVQQSGRLDILVNNAGIAHIGTAESTTPEDMDRLYAVNVRSVYSCSHFAIPHMKKNGGGSIVNLSSVAAVTGIAERFAYSMSKGAILTMTYSMAKDFINDGIRCNAVGPARIHTPFVDGYLEKYFPDNKVEIFEKLSRTQPIGRMGKPEEVAQLIAYLCSDDAGFLTGGFYPIDGGFITLNTG
jgi:NAD(P)-dependent dehydrogenase (short-subunit alcohol dehydrogenase family)